MIRIYYTIASFEVYSGVRVYDDVVRIRVYALYVYTSI